MARNQQRNGTSSVLDCDKQFSSAVVKFSSDVEEIIACLFCKEEQLQQRPDIGTLQETSFNQLLDEYSLHEKFMTEICEYCHTIMKCKEEGQELRDGDNDLNEEDRDEVGIQMDAMLVLYDKLKILTTDRLHDLQRIIEERQRSKIERLEKWLSSMESKLAGSDNIGPDFEAIQRQLVEMEELKGELEQKQEFLNLVSRVIVFDDVDLESSQMRSRSCESLDRRLDNMNGRWTKICQFVTDRHERLNKAGSIWRLLRMEGPQLASWLRKIQLGLNELADAARGITDPQIEKAFIAKLLARSEKIETEMKGKQSFYTSLESRVRTEIERFDDPCSMLVIELEKQLEDMQDNWNSIMRQKRMIDFSLQALSSPDAISNNAMRPIIPVPDSITTRSNSNLKFHNDTGDGRDDRLTIADPESCNEPLTNSSSFGNDDDNSSPQLNGSLSDARAFDNSVLSQDTRSLIYGNTNQEHSQYRDLERDPTLSFNNSHDELSSATNLTSPPPNNQTYIIDSVAGKPDYVYMRESDCLASLNDDELVAKLSALPISAPDHGCSDGVHSCRVEEWKHSLESFSNWLRQVEVSLEMHSAMADHPIDSKSNRGTGGATGGNKTWSEMNLPERLTLVQNIEDRIATSCQDEFDCLFLQGQQIIEDLMPEIGENEYEANLKAILADIEMRYVSVKRCLDERKRDLSDKDSCRKLLRDLQEHTNHLIDQMSAVIPEEEIGVDLITLAQQQDQLMHQREELEGNGALSSCIEKAEEFLMICDSQYGQSSAQIRGPSMDIYLSFGEFRDDIKHHLDLLTISYSDLSQLIKERLERLDEVHREMHALQHSIQDLAAKLQMAEILKSKWVPLDDLSIEELSEQLEDLKLYRERLSEVESTYKAMNSITDWMDQSRAPLSQSNLKRIDELSNIWDYIQESVEDRQKLIEHAFDEQSGSEQKFLAETVADLPKWERRVATSKVPYFIDHQTNKTLWDHPKFTDILNSMDECKRYVFSVYRTAMKLRLVQKRLGIDKLMLEQLKELTSMIDTAPVQASKTGNNQQQLADTQSVRNNSTASDDASVGIEQIILLLKAIYEKIQTSETPALDVPVAIDLTLNWLLNLYDSTRTGRVNVLSLKVGLALICCATREEKYVYMFELVANHTTGVVDPKKLGTLFEICMRIPTYLGEGESFGDPDLIESSIRKCFDMAKFNPQHPNCIDLLDYLNWLKTEPQVIIWLTVLHRLLISENTQHKMPKVPQIQYLPEVLPYGPTYLRSL